MSHKLNETLGTKKIIVLNFLPQIPKSFNSFKLKSAYFDQITKHCYLKSSHIEPPAVDPLQHWTVLCYVTPDEYYLLRKERGYIVILF